MLRGILFNKIRDIFKSNIVFKYLYVPLATSSDGFNSSLIQQLIFVVVRSVGVLSDTQISVAKT